MNNSKENHEPHGQKFAVMAMFLVLILAGCKDLFHSEEPGAKNGGTYTVSYNANGGSGTAPAVQTVSAGVSIIVAGSGLSKPSYIFSGWNTGDDGMGDAYIPGASLAVYMDITLYAQWTAEATQCTVSYNANDGSGTPPDFQTVSVGTVITVADGSGLSRSGYTFTGWNTIADGKGGAYAVGSSLSVYGNTALYAQWTNQATQYTVSYNVNDGSGTLPASQTVIGGFIITVADGSGLSRSGSIFTGWNTRADGRGDAYAAGASMTVNADTTLYAQWAAMTLAASLSWIADNAVEGGDYTIIVWADEAIAPTELSYSGKTVAITLKGDSTMRTVSLSSPGSPLFTIWSGVTLTLDNNLTLQGRSDNTSTLVAVEHSNFIMNNRSKITGNTNSSLDSSGVYVGYDSNFTMNGGEISGNTGNYGGGVYVGTHGSFTMNGGEISGNTVSNGGGGVYVDTHGSFTMNSGKILRNTSDGGGGVSAVGNSFTMSGGEISGNTAYRGGGVFAVGDSFTMSGGKISGNTAYSGGGGVLLISSFTMSGGEISGNTAYSGGGVFVLGGSYKKQPASGHTTSGIIYGYTAGDDKSNKVVSSGTVQTDKGNAVYVLYDGGSLQKREITAGQTDHLDSTQNGSAGGWE